MKGLMLLAFALSSCLSFSGSCSQPKGPDYLWTGPACEIKGIFQPVFGVWCIPSQTGWKLHKSTSDVGRLREIIHYLCEPQEFMLIEIGPDQPHQLLWLAYLDPRYDKWTLKKIRFKMRHGVFIGPRGKSKKLAELLAELDDCEAYFIRPDPEEIRQMMKELHEQWEKTTAGENANQAKL